MKVKEFLEYFEDFDPESELKFDFVDEKIDDYGDFEKFYTPIYMADINYLDEIDTVFISFE